MQQQEIVHALRQRKAEVIAKRSRLDDEIARVDLALDAFSSSRNGPVKPRGKRRTREQIKQVVLDHLRRNSQTEFGINRLARDARLSPSSVYAVMPELISAKSVDQIGETKRGKPVVRHRPVSVKPGEAVRDA